LSSRWLAFARSRLLTAALAEQGVAVADLTDPEIILNLWFVQDREGIIYSLRARAYVGVGSEQDKLSLLRRFASIDYLIARPFPVPEAFHTHFPESDVIMPVAYRKPLDLFSGPLDIFEHAIRALNDEIPSQTKLEIPRSPLVCITTLVGDDAESIRPVIEGTRRL
jgi:hypothetical protein